MAYQGAQVKGGGILYCVVARGTCIIASHCAIIGNFNVVAQDVLAKIDLQRRTSASPVPSKMTSQENNYFYHYSIIDDTGLIILCITDESFPRKNAFDFMDVLERILFQQANHEHRRLSTEYEPLIKAAIKKANTEAMNSLLVGDGLSPDAGNIRRGNAGKPDKIDLIKSDVEATRIKMVENIEIVVERGKKLKDLEDEIEILNQNAPKFNRGCRQVARQMWWENQKIRIFIGGAVAVVVLIIVIVLIAQFS